MKINFQNNNKNLIIRLSGELDHHTACNVREKIDKEINKGRVKNIVFDFEEVPFMDSSGIGVIIGRYKLIKKYEGKAMICNLNPQVQRIVKISGLFKIIFVYSSVEEAIKINIKILGGIVMSNNSMKLEFLSQSKNESFARTVVAAFVAQLDPTLEELADVKTAVSEAVTNAIIHGYENTSGIVKIECSIKNDIVQIIIEDKGQGIQDVKQAMEPLYTAHPEMERSGMGFTVMETFMDKLYVESEKDKGTKITMIKRFDDIQNRD